MKITPSILSIPPYISTSWKNVISLHLKPSLSFQDLVITLTNHSVITIPSLDAKTIETIFQAHEKFLEQEASLLPSKALPLFPPSSASMSFGVPMKMKEMEMFNGMGGILQHNPEQAHFPPLPEEMLSKIHSVSKMVGLEKQLDQIPKAEPHCQCPYCQIARALHQEPSSSKLEEEPKEELVNESDLTFREWDLKELDKHLYEVSNPLDKNEKFQVFIGSPIGCTCGCKNCEHIKAVLNS